MNGDTTSLERFTGEAPAFSALVGDVRGVSTVRVRGEIDLATVDALVEAIGRACSRLDGRLVACVDLRDVRFAGVVAVRALVEQAEAMRELGGELQLILPDEGPVARAFELLNAGARVPLYRDLPES